MFALKMFGGPLTRFAVCSSKPWTVSSACKNFKGQHPIGAEISSVKKVDLGGSELTCTTLWMTKVHRTSLAERGRNRSRSHIFLILDTLSRSGDIRDQSRKMCKIGSNFACFWPPKFFIGGSPESLDMD